MSRADYISLIAVTVVIKCLGVFTAAVLWLGNDNTEPNFPKSRNCIL